MGLRFRIGFVEMVFGFLEWAGGAGVVAGRGMRRGCGIVVVGSGGGGEGGEFEAVRWCFCLSVCDAQSVDERDGDRDGKAKVR